MSKCTNKLPNTMHGKTDETEITHIFIEKYRSLYNSVGYSKRNMDLLRKDIASRITNGCASNSDIADHKHSITASEVKNAVEMLKNDKKEENGLNSNHIIHGTDRLFL